MLEHLQSIDGFTELGEADIPALVAAQAGTAEDMLAQMGSPEHLVTFDQAQQARNAFAAVTNPNVTDEEKRKGVLTLRVPQAVRHLAGMLSQYDWEYVEQAKELRGYVVAKLLEETRHPDAKVRLKSLELVGKLTEVGSFTERIEVTKRDVTSSELEDRIRAKLSALLPKPIDITDAQLKPT
jgi:hypothetical protein